MEPLQNLDNGGCLKAAGSDMKPINLATLQPCHLATLHPADSSLSPKAPARPLSCCTAGKPWCLRMAVTKGRSSDQKPPQRIGKAPR